MTDAPSEEELVTIEKYVDDLAADMVRSQVVALVAALRSERAVLASIQELVNEGHSSTSTGTAAEYWLDRIDAALSSQEAPKA